MISRARARAHRGLFALRSPVALSLAGCIPPAAAGEGGVNRVGAAACDEARAGPAGTAPRAIALNPVAVAIAAQLHPAPPMRAPSRLSAGGLEGSYGRKAALPGALPTGACR
jgi:hypothetical protein